MRGCLRTNAAAETLHPAAAESTSDQPIPNLAAAAKVGPDNGDVAAAEAKGCVAAFCPVRAMLDMALLDMALLDMALLVWTAWAAGPAHQQVWPECEAAAGPARQEVWC